MPDDVAIRPIDAQEATARLDDLAGLLVDAVASGASVNFMAGFGLDEGRTFWRGQLPGLAAGERRLFVAETAGGLVGTVVLGFAPQPNQPHRAEIGKMLVHSGQRRRGLGRRLLEAAETSARRAGRTLLMLDTTAGSAGEALYRAQGWIEYGRVPGHALSTDGLPTDTVFFYKQLGSVSENQAR